MIRIERTPWDFRAVTAAGQPIATFGTPEQAARWAEEEARHWPGCRIERQRVTTTTETVFEQPMEKAA